MSDQKFEKLGKPVITGDGSISVIHPEHGECYHSESGALMEAENLYIESSGIVNSFATKSEVRVLDVGLGLGYNALATFNSWKLSSGESNLQIHSLEVNEDLVEAIASGKAPWQESWSQDDLGFACCLQRKDNYWSGFLEHPKTKKQLLWTVYIGDAMDMDRFGEGFDYIWQDPFSPKKNPTMWSENWFNKIYPLAKSGAIMMTYSVSRVVKDALSAGGWDWVRFEAKGNKRDWLRAVKP